MNIIVVGAGMYVTGRNGSGTGTVLSALAQYSKSHPLGRVTVVATRLENKIKVAEQVSAINAKLNSQLSVDYKALGENAEIAFLDFVRANAFDCAIISTPDHLHHFYAKELLKKGVHCLVVKPLCPTESEVIDLISTQHKNRCYGAVEFHKRLDETNLYAKKIIESGELGQLLYFTIDYSQRIHIPLETFRGWAHQTNIFQYLAVHYVDLIYFLTRAKPIRVSACGTEGILRQSGVQTYDSVHASIVWKTSSSSEFISQFAVNWIDPNASSAMSDQRFKVVGTMGRLEVDQKHRGLEKVNSTGTEHPNPYFSEYLPDENGGLKFSGYGYESIKRFLLDVVDIQSGKMTPQSLTKIRPSFEEALVSTRVVEAVNKSLLAQANWIQIND